MNKKIISAEEMITLFEMFTDKMLNNNISFEDYIPKFKTEYACGTNSPLELMYKGFIGGLYIASLIDEIPEE